MAVTDLTGKFIANTYQNVVQCDYDLSLGSTNNLLYNGKGGLINIDSDIIKFSQLTGSGFQTSGRDVTVTSNGGTFSLYANKVKMISNILSLPRIQGTNWYNLTTYEDHANPWYDDLTWRKIIDSVDYDRMITCRFVLANTSGSDSHSVLYINMEGGCSTDSTKNGNNTLNEVEQFSTGGFSVGGCTLTCPKIDAYNNPGWGSISFYLPAGYYFYLRRTRVTQGSFGGSEPFGYYNSSSIDWYWYMRATELKVGITP